MTTFYHIRVNDLKKLNNKNYLGKKMADTYDLFLEINDRIKKFTSSMSRDGIETMSHGRISELKEKKANEGDEVN